MVKLFFLERFLEGEKSEEMRKSNASVIQMIRQFCKHHSCISCRICTYLFGNNDAIVKWTEDTMHPIGSQWAEQFGVVDVVDLTREDGKGEVNMGGEK